MNISLRPKTAKVLWRLMKQGGYADVDDIITAGLASLDQQMRVGDFAPGDLDKLRAVADREIERGELLDGDEALFVRQRRRARVARS